MNSASPTKNWKAILLTRTRWPKNFQVQGVPQLPHKPTWWNTCEDASLRWCWYLYRMPGGREYFVGIWPGNGTAIDKHPPKHGYVRLSIRETFQFCLTQCFDEQVLKDLRRVKTLPHPGLLPREKENRSAAGRGLPALPD
ncbi:MAG: hypothetical protein MUF81_01960 [Verrucomicrobia bacterium]|jgi:hypothetical protein|nr:hypothetical protein [Verrucomicrobiota bacterium]